MRKVVALMRANWLIASSYRLNLVITLLTLLASIVPVYFIAGALQPVIEEHISDQGGQYFAFVLVGLAAFSFLGVAVGTMPRAVGGGIGSGTLEVMMSTPTSVPTLLAGFLAYDLLWTAVRTMLLLGAGAVLGAQFDGSRLVPAAAILALTIIAYLPFGLIGAALILAFRTSGPLARVVTTISALLGGVYYPTKVIPSWLENVADLVPLTYGLRAVRRTLLEGEPVRAVLGDVSILVVFAAALFAVGATAFTLALRYARRTGTLGHY